VLHAHTQEQARQVLERRPDLLPAAVSSLLIGVTGFFRDEPVFETLRTAVLPKLAPRARACCDRHGQDARGTPKPDAHAPLRVWSAACANGAELYSVAILLAQAGILENSFLLGTDCRHDALKQARTATYSSEDLRNVEPSDRRRYFEQAGSLWRPVESLCRQAHWRGTDLCRGVEEGPWDIILWRNMAIYLTSQAAATVWRGLASVLAPGGVLVVGKAERPPVELELTGVGRYIYSRGSATGRSSCRSQARPTNRIVHGFPEMFE
jgi:chemotaxis methyl-accepting protein methylase